LARLNPRNNDVCLDMDAAIPEVHPGICFGVRLCAVVPRQFNEGLAACVCTLFAPTHVAQKRFCCTRVLIVCCAAETPPVSGVASFPVYLCVSAAELTGYLDSGLVADSKRDDLVFLSDG
jgi:hypothetical protein